MIKKTVGDLKRWFYRVNHAVIKLPDNKPSQQPINGISDFSLLEFSHSTPLKGFYMLEIHADQKFNNEAVYLTCGESNGQQQGNCTFHIKLGRRHTVKRIVYLHTHVSVFHIYGMNCVLGNNNVSIKFSRVSSKYALTRMAAKINNHGAGHDATHGLIHDVYTQYNRMFSHSSIDACYPTWLLSNEHFNNVLPLDEQRVLFSVVMPVYKVDLNHLRQAIESVIKQTYSNWELCIAEDCTNSADIKQLLNEFVRHDSRIKVKFRTENGNISAASNSALSMAKGDYIVLLDHDDELSAHALNEVALSLKNKKSKIIYSDEDKICESGIRFAPHFKSDFNYELILSHNYMSHLGVYDRDLVKKVGCFREGYEGAQDYDLLLRCLLHVDKGDVTHIPKVLYHWRALEGSTALQASEKGYTHVAGLKSIKDYLAHVNNTWQAESGPLPNTYKVKRPILDSPKVSIIIPTKDQHEILKVCIDSIYSRTDYKNYEIIIVNNASVEKKTLAYFKSIKSRANIRVLDYPAKFNYSAINNYAVSQCTTSDYVLLLNNDVEVINASWLGEMLALAQQDDVGCVGAKLYYSNGSIQHGGVILGIGGVAGHSHKYFSHDAHGYFSRLKLMQDISAVTAACLLVKRDTYLSVNGLDENNLTIAFNDVDFCLKVRETGLRNVWTPFAQLYHHESISRGAEDTPEKVARFNSEVDFMKATWGDKLISDPYYNINLTLQHENFGLR